MCINIKKNFFKQDSYMIHFDLFYLASRFTELTSQPRDFNLVFSFVRMTILG